MYVCADVLVGYRPELSRLLPPARIVVALNGVLIYCASYPQHRQGFDLLLAIIDLWQMFRYYEAKKKEENYPFCPLRNKPRAETCEAPDKVAKLQKSG